MKIAFFPFFLFSLFSVVFSQDYDPAKDLPAPEVLLPISQNIECFHPAERGQEWRGLWVDAWNKGISSPEQVKETVQIAQKYGYNAIVVQVRRRGDAIYFPTLPNTEPRISTLPANFDVLAEYIKQAHSVGIEVHAWFTTFLISTKTLPTSPQHVCNAHPEYLMENMQGEKLIGEGYYLDPGHPGALAWNETVAMDLIAHYAIDGIHFDYVRYPQSNSGYNPVAIARFNKEYGLTGKPANDDPKFSDWRRRQITDWLRIMYARIMSVKPLLKVSAATFAGRSDAYHNRFQDWANWMHEGILDINFPMNYSKDPTIYQTRVEDTIKYSYGRHVYMGVGAYLLSANDTISQLRYARNSGSHGLILFSYANNCVSPSTSWLVTYQQIQQDIFPTFASVPDMDWKISPKNGFISGVVTDKATNAKLYNAKITFVANNYNKVVYTDSLGRYASVNIPVGECSVTFESFGYKTIQQKNFITAGKLSNIDVEMVSTTDDIILDNEQAQFIGNWTLADSATDKFGTNYRYIGKTGVVGKAIFNIPSTIQGRYRVYVWYPAGTNRTISAQYAIQHSEGKSTITINQQQNGGKWNLIGLWNFSATEDQNISIMESSETGKVVIADAIRLEQANTR